MAKYRYETITVPNLNQASGITSVNTDTEADFFSITVYGATSGTVAFDFKTIVGSDFEEVVDPATSLQQVIDFSTDINSFIFYGYISSIQVTPTAVVGDYTLVVQQGEA